jgi:hypothetical protein
MASHVAHRLKSKVHIEQLFKHCSNIKRSISLEKLFDSLRNILNIPVFYSLIPQSLQTKLSLEETMQFLLHLLVFLQQKTTCTIVQASQFDKGISTIHPSRYLYNMYMYPPKLHAKSEPKGNCECTPKMAKMARFIKQCKYKLFSLLPNNYISQVSHLTQQLLECGYLSHFIRRTRGESRCGTKRGPTCRPCQ